LVVLDEVTITGRGAVCAAGSGPKEIFRSYLSGKSALSLREYFGGVTTPVGVLSERSERLIQELVAQNDTYPRLDRTAHLAMLCAEQAVNSAGWGSGEKCSTGVNVGSSRGATGAFEQGFESFLQSENGRVSPFTSPITTPGNISSWVGQHLRRGSEDGIYFDHSVTCSSGVFALGNGLAWLRSGMCDRFLCGAVEAPLTPFTVSQMKALRIYSADTAHPFPSRPCAAAASESTMVLGEGGAVFALEQRCSGGSKRERALAVVESFGTGMEQIDSPTSLSSNGEALERSMRSALSGLDPSEQKIDVLVLHAPGTLGGDAAELRAVEAVFGENRPYCVSQKWLTGHTLGAAGVLGIDIGISILQSQRVGKFPYPSEISQFESERPLHRVMVNAVGFGGNAASVILRKE
jgi:3-oxoacyl-(acyl-carrier-protein) synthase